MKSKKNKTKNTRGKKNQIKSKLKKSTNSSKTPSLFLDCLSRGSRGMGRRIERDGNLTIQSPQHKKLTRMQYLPSIASERQGCSVLSPHLRSLKRLFQDFEVQEGGGVGESMGHGETDEIYSLVNRWNIHLERDDVRPCVQFPKSIMNYLFIYLFSWDSRYGRLLSLVFR